MTEYSQSTQLSTQVNNVKTKEQKNMVIEAVHEKNIELFHAIFSNDVYMAIESKITLPP